MKGAEWMGGREYGPTFEVESLEIDGQPYVPPAALLASAKSEVLACRALLEAAKCPACDGSGLIPYQIGEAEWEAEQCQWCYERGEAVHALAPPTDRGASKEPDASR